MKLRNSSWAVFVLLLFLSGCGAVSDKTESISVAPEVSEKATEEHAVSTEISLAESQNYVVPKKYTESREQIRFDFEPEMPDGIRGISECNVKKMSANADKAMEIFGEGKTITATDTLFADETGFQRLIYDFADGSTLSAGTVFSYVSENFSYYSRVGVPSYSEDLHSEEELDFMSKAECVAYLQNILSETGFSSAELDFVCYSVSADQLQRHEEEAVSTGFIAGDKAKGTWTAEDDAYVIYGSQKWKEIPVFNEIMSMHQTFALETLDNSPIMAIISSRGVEYFMCNYIYQFENTEQRLQLKPFEEIVQVVADKFNNLLSDSTYLADKARLYEMVCLNTDQQYTAKPIWYFEVGPEDSESRTVTLVDAVTGKEIFL